MRRTGQIGAIRIVGAERHKGGVRVTFVAGRRALADAREKDAVLTGMAASFTCGVPAIAGAVDKLRAELAERTSALARARGEFVALLAEGPLAAHPADPSGTTWIHVERTDGDPGMLRTLAGRLAARPDVVAVVTAPDGSGGRFVVVQRGAAASADCKKWLDERIAERGGRGGGKPDRAEGKLAS